MILLIDKCTVERYHQVPAGKNTFDFEKIIQEVQNVELKSKISDDFFSDMMANYKSENYKVLMKGGVYVCDGVNYHMVGLEAVLSHWTYARYKEQGNTIATSFGFTQKNNPSSTPVEQQDLDRQARKLRQDADYHWSEIEKYIARSDYFSKFACATQSKLMPKITVIK